jgi:hypothetical protein
MSSGIELIILAPLIAAELLPAALGAVGAIGEAAAQQLALAGQAAADALAAMKREHEAALAELAQRQSDELGAARERTATEAAEAGSARALAALTHMRATGGTRQMLRAGLAHLEARCSGLDPRPPDMAEAIAALAVRVDGPEADLAQALEQYQQLAARVAQTAVAQAQSNTPGAQAPPVQALLAEVAILLESPLFMLEHAQAQHEVLSAKWRELERLAQTQPALAESMALGLRSRINTALEELAAALKAQAQRAGELRERTGQLLGLLSALESPGVPPPDRAHAMALRARLAQVLAEAGDAALGDAVQALLAEAQALYSAVERSLASQVAQALVGSQVVDVLAGLGYSVEVLDTPEAQARQFRVPLSAEAGVELQLDRDGLLKSELVAYAPLDEAAAQQNEQLVCHVMDQLLAQLQERKLAVRERFRTHYAKGDRPRVVARTRAARRGALQPELQRRELPGDER